MKGKIDKDGFLWIERKGEWTKQFCPFVSKVWCGHWCPLFGEPEMLDGKPSLSLCRKVLKFDFFEDARWDERGQE